MGSVYPINKGINREIEFKGLRAQYIWWLGGLVIVLLLLFAILYIVGVPALVCVICVIAPGAYGVRVIYGLSKQHGRYGLMKQFARRRLPRVVKFSTRQIFYNGKDAG